ncbi:DUF4804 domain-containing protein, partial [bacterium]|nr:DUF4804 domain-containing protein [bacterium]
QKIFKEEEVLLKEENLASQSQPAPQPQLTKEEIYSYDNSQPGAPDEYSDEEQDIDKSVSAETKMKFHDKIEGYKSSDKFKTSKGDVKVFYNDAYFDKGQINDKEGTEFGSLNRLLTKVQKVCVDGDQYFKTLDRQEFKGNKAVKVLASIGDEKNAIGFDKALVLEERKKSRKKVIASDSLVFAKGGYPASSKIEENTNPQECIVISAAGPQFEMMNKLEYQDFIIDLSQNQSKTTNEFSMRYCKSTNGDIPDFYTVNKQMGNKKETENYLKISDTMILNKEALLNSYIEDIYLILKSFDQMVADKNKREGTNKKGYFKTLGLGLGFFANIAGINDIGECLAPVMVEAYNKVLNNYKFENIGQIDFSAFGHLETALNKYPLDNKINGIEITSGKKDIFDFDGINRDEYIVGALNPSDSNALVGNELNYQSVEAMMGENSTITVDQTFITNDKLTDKENFVPVKIDIVQKKEDKKDSLEEPLDNGYENRPTSGQGNNCAIHAAFGKWNGYQYYCEDAQAIRKALVDYLNAYENLNQLPKIKLNSMNIFEQAYKDWTHSHYSKDKRKNYKNYVNSIRTGRQLYLSELYLIAYLSNTKINYWPNFDGKFQLYEIVDPKNALKDKGKWLTGLSCNSVKEANITGQMGHFEHFIPKAKEIDKKEEIKKEVIFKNIFEKDNLDITAAINYLKTDPNIKNLYEMSAHVNEGYTIEQHTKNVLGIFESQFKFYNLDQKYKPLFRLMLALHDIGKGVDF